MKFVAVTACPTGIAHSQMAAENLEATAEERGHEIHVEIQGAMGTENEISETQISEADAVIIAADTSVSRDRFEGKTVIKATVKDAVNDASELIDEAIEKVEASGEEPEGTRESAAEATSGDDESAASAATDAEDETRTTSEETRTSRDGLLARLKKIFS